MKSMKKCVVTKEKISKSIKLDKRRDKRRSSAGMFYTSSAGAVTSLILCGKKGYRAITSLVMVIMLSFLSSAFLSITGFAGANTYADSISMTVSTDNLTINMAPMSSSGEFAKSGNMNIAVSTTSSSGYNLSIASSTGNTNLTSGSNSIASINSAISESTFSSSSTYNNKWGYKPSNLYNSSTEQIITNTDFRPLPGTAGEIIAKTKCANGTSPCTNPVDNYTLSIGTRTTNTTPKGDYVSDTFVITAVTNKNVITCHSSKLCIQYDGNGLSFPETSSQLPRTVNNVNYNSTTTQAPITKYSHTSNIDDSGTASGTYPTDQATTDVVTIPGATELNITIYYATGRHGSYGLDATAYVFEGEYTGSISYNTTGYFKKYQSGTGTTKETANTETFTVSGDTVTFGFYSATERDVVYPAYGYYAIITGTSTAYERSVSSGEYATPTLTGTNPVFHGWSTSQTTPGGGFPSDVEYANESEILAKMPGDEGETKTLYAVWQQSQTITFTMDSNVTKIDVLDASGATVGTITSSGQSLILAQGDTYTLKPTYATGYTYKTITKTSGSGTVSGRSFTVGTGSATINFTSQTYPNMQNYSCSSLANIGDMIDVKDTRDNEVYLIGKLADGKCWMLDNLRLDLTNSTILNGLTTTNTHVNSASLTSLKSGNRSAGAQYASSGFVKWDSSSSSNVYNQAKANADYKDTTTTSYGDGSGKIGVYYNYCAASAGSYCYDEGAGTGNASYDLCPAGWRMPTSDSSGEYKALYTAYSSDATSFRNALSTPLSGYFYNGSARDQSSGYFWSSTYRNADNMRYLGVNSSNVSPSSYYYRELGYSVRCLLSS